MEDRAECGGQQHRQGQEEEAEGAGEEAEGRGEEEDPDRRGEVGARGPDPRAEGEAGGQEGGVRAWQQLLKGVSTAAEQVPEPCGAFSGGAHNSLCLDHPAQRAVQCALLSRCDDVGCEGRDLLPYLYPSMIMRAALFWAWKRKALGGSFACLSSRSNLRWCGVSHQ